jgi:uncharacterized protein (UPF0264 family)
MNLDDTLERLYGLQRRVEQAQDGMLDVLRKLEDAHDAVVAAGWTDQNAKRFEPKWTEFMAVFGHVNRAEIAVLQDQIRDAITTLEAYLDDDD